MVKSEMGNSYDQLEQVRIASNTRLLFEMIGFTIPCTTLRSLKSACAREPLVSAAFLSKCTLPDESVSRLVLVIEVERFTEIRGVACRMMDTLQGVECQGQEVDILPMPGSSVPCAVLETGLRVA